MEKAVIALKVKSDKSGIRTAVYQACQLCMQAWKSNIEVIDCIRKLQVQVGHPHGKN